MNISQPKLRCEKFDDDDDDDNNNNNNNNTFIIKLSSGPQSDHSGQLLAYRLNANPTQVTQSPARS